MKAIMNLVERINEELEDAKNYAESYIDCKSRENDGHANKYKEMSNDELKHANYIHEIAINEIDRLEKVFVPTEEMREVWRKSHALYVEKTAWIRQMLSM